MIGLQCSSVSAWILVVQPPSDRSRPLLIDAKFVADGGSWWLKDAFRGH